MWWVLRLRAVVAAGLAICTITVTGVTLLSQSASCSPRRPAVENGVIWRVPTAAPDIAITFDDGPDPTYTPQVLALLRDYWAVGTFFVLGRQVQAYSALVQQEAAQGSQVCSHGWSHAKFRRLKPAVVRAEVGRTQALLQRLGVPECRLFRFPYFTSDARARAVIASMGYRLVGANVDTRDWCRRDGPVMGREVLDRVRPGDIILLHDGGGPRTASLEALKVILDGLPAKGLKPVTMSQLLAETERSRPPLPNEE